MAKILIVEDDAVLCETLTDWLTYQHYVVEVVKNGRTGLEALLIQKYDAVVLDWQLPELSGPEVCQQFRSKGGVTPILMLTGKSNIKDKTAGLDAGADDYLTKPFEMEELSARLRALLRRPIMSVTGNVLKINDLELDATKHSVSKCGVEVSLLPKEFSLLEFLMRHPDELFSGEALIERVWRSEEYVTSDAIRSTLMRLRKKLAVPEGPPQIVTLHGLGYKLKSQ